MKNIRINIQDLIYAARALGEFKVVAAGSMYATLELNADQRFKISEAGVDWSYD